MITELLMESNLYWEIMVVIVEESLFQCGCNVLFRQIKRSGKNIAKDWLNKLELDKNCWVITT